MKKISIVTPTYNSEKTILDTCRSITSQNYKNFEHIIIDNCSTDSTIQLIQDHYLKTGLQENLQIIIEKDRGISDAFNKGIMHSRGDIIAILNSDDYYLSNKLFSDIEKIFINSSINLIHGKMYFFDEYNGTNIREPLLCKIQLAMPFNHPTCFVRKSLYDTYGLFKLNYKFAMDFEWVSRFYNDRNDSNGSFYFSDYVISFVRGEGASVSNELVAVKEFKNALLDNNKWNPESHSAFIKRIFRVKTKIFLNKYGLFFPVKIWRHFKWRQ